MFNHVLQKTKNNTLTFNLVIIRVFVILRPPTPFE